MTEAPAASWFDGRSSRAQPVGLTLSADALSLHLADGRVQRYARRGIQWPERTRHGMRQILLPDGSLVEVPDGPAWDVWAAEQGLSQPLAVRWALSYRSVALALAAMVVLSLAAWRWGIPWAAEIASAWVPQAAREQLDRSVIAQLQARGWLQPTALSETQQRRIREDVDAMVRAAYRDDPAPPYRLSFHRLPDWAGPNAFALPGGQIVLTDELVKLLPSTTEATHPGVLGVVAHELGHVRLRHGLRMTIEAAAVSAWMGLWIGDTSAVLAGAPTMLLQAGYSRGHERAADDEALRILQAARVDPRGMVQFFAALRAAVPKRDGNDPLFGLSTHPPDSERERLFGQGRR